MNNYEVSVMIYTAIVFMQVLISILSSIFFLREGRLFFHKDAKYKNNTHTFVFFVANPALGALISLFYCLQFKISFGLSLLILIVYPSLLIILSVLLIILTGFFTQKS
ncbi:hypothetical protein A2V49_00380 [candidate division WWE3 bacterium RBG_19FT_COMBO_34_6]|uniref:Uncharacterized protein n=1 Tax=candidate division WWE3 bacterium RBG_19FT_COMBO_34_6 TaxID=1802612 RepID=A0A1F4UN24_UNCKA|nr:MAG: hypothetical protein A2V49_00380 [candidate division WWE3 bacterium RBG_19FT_COMBO_34_6]